jgi:cell division septation protein DedD
VLQLELAGLQAEHERSVGTAHLQQQQYQQQQRPPHHVPPWGQQYMQGGTRPDGTHPYPGTTSNVGDRQTPQLHLYAAAASDAWTRHGPQYHGGSEPLHGTGQPRYTASNGHTYHPDASNGRPAWSAGAGQQTGAPQASTKAGGHVYIVELPDSDEEEQTGRGREGAQTSGRGRGEQPAGGQRFGDGSEGWGDDRARPAPMYPQHANYTAAAQPAAHQQPQHWPQEKNFSTGSHQAAPPSQMPPQGPQQGVSCAVRETVINRQVRQSPHTVMQHTVTVTEVMQQPNSGYSAQAQGSAASPAKQPGAVPGAATDTAATAVKTKKPRAPPKHVGEGSVCMGCRLLALLGMGAVRQQY